MGVSLWHLVLPAAVLTVFPWVLFAACLLVAVWLVVQIVTLAGQPPSSIMPGVWRPTNGRH
jgi:hypothetical protein